MVLAELAFAFAPSSSLGSIINSLQVEDSATENESAHTVGAKGRVFPEALTQVSFSWGGCLLLQVKCMVRS